MPKQIQLFHFDCFALLSCPKEDFDEESYFFSLLGFFSTRQDAERFAISCERARVEATYAEWENHRFNVRGTLADHPLYTMFAVVPLTSVTARSLTDLEGSLEDAAKGILCGVGGSAYIVETLDIRRERESR